MNNTINNNVTSANASTVDILIQEAYESYIVILVNISVGTLLSYATVLRLSQEIEHIWEKRFNLPSILYILTRYTSIIQLAITLGSNWIPSTSIRSCIVISDIQSLFDALSYIGGQGLLIARAYSLCKGNKLFSGVLAFGFVSGLGSFLLSVIPYDLCTASSASTVPAIITIAIFMQSFFVIFTDFVVFGICMREIWGAWKLKREVGISHPGDLVSMLMKQSVLRFCFVVFITTSSTVIWLIYRNPETIVVNIAGLAQNSLSTILIADFTLELRQCNSTAIQINNVSLPSLSFRSALQHVHQSVLVEMGTPPENVNVQHERNDDEEPVEPAEIAESEGVHASTGNDAC